jgi:hypothetical protein
MTSEEPVAQLKAENATLVQERCQVQHPPRVRLVVNEYKVLHLALSGLLGSDLADFFLAEVHSRVQYGLRLWTLAVYLVEQ